MRFSWFVSDAGDIKTRERLVLLQCLQERRVLSANALVPEMLQVPPEVSVTHWLTSANAPIQRVLEHDAALKDGLID